MLHIRRNVVKLSGQPILVKEPKTRAGVRVVYLSKELCTLLRVWQKESAWEKKQRGEGGLEDEDYLDAVQNIIDTQKVNAEYAVAVTGDNFAQMFAAMEDEYMRGRAADVKDISERIVRVLSGGAGQGIHTDEPVIILADDLAPSETVQLEKDKVLSFVTVHGSVNSHTAILARTMSIPALIGTDVALDATVAGKFAVVDGTNGVLYVEPDEETLETMRRRQREEQEKKELLQTLKGRETVTLDGKKIRLYANIGNSKDLASVIQNDAAGIGLFRSEFLYLEKETFPTEEEQFQVYKQVAETMADRSQKTSRSSEIWSPTDVLKPLHHRHIPEQR